MSWMSPVTGLFAVVIGVVLVVAWAVSSGRIRTGWTAPYAPAEPWRADPGIEWDTHVVEPRSAQPDPDRLLPTHTQEHAHGRHEAQNR